MSKYIDIIEESTAIMNQSVAKLANEMKAASSITNISSVDISKADPTNPEGSVTREG